MLCGWIELKAAYQTVMENTQHKSTDESKVEMKPLGYKSR